VPSHSGGVIEDSGKGAIVEDAIKKLAKAGAVTTIILGVKPLSL
jgi:hypothetical protein